MRRLALVTAIVFFSGATLVAGACADKKDENNVSTVDAMAQFAMPELDAGAEKVHYVPDGGLFVDPGGRDGILVTQGVVTMKAINGGRVEGTIRLMETRDGIKAALDLKNLTYMSKYTLRVHMLGNCSTDDGTSAGPGFAFDDSSLEPSDPASAGLLGEIQGDLNGNAKGEAAIAGPAIRGPWSIIGRSIVLHAEGDGLDKDPNGKRIGCGTVGIYADIVMSTGGDQ